MKNDHDAYGIPIVLHEQIKQHLAQLEESSPGLDGIILKLGPHHVAHFIATTHDRDAADRLLAYLATYWPAYFVLIERMLFAAHREQNAELMSDFGQS